MSKTFVARENARADDPFPDWDYSALGKLRTRERSPLRNLLDDYLAWGGSKHAIHAFTSVDISRYVEVSQAIKSRRGRPPSLVAYVTRCIGAALEQDKGSLGGRLGRRVSIPDAVNVAAMVSANTPDGDAIPYIMEILRANERSLPDIGEEMAARARAMRRNGIEQSAVLRNAVKLGGQPALVRRNLYRLAMLHPRFRQYIAHYCSYVGLTSLTQYTGRRPFWGVPIMPYTFYIVMGGHSRKPVVDENDNIVPRECLDMTFCSDHGLIDGALGLEMSGRICAEIESGRLLAEAHDGRGARPTSP